MIGQTISHYRILSKLGEGGMGVVYKAEDLTLQRTVALKFLPRESLATKSDRSRLVHEARAAAVLLHPNICPVYEIGESEGRTFIAMGYLEGRTLKERICEGPLSVDEALRLAKEIGEGLSAAHGKGIVHRDVKPGNVMVTPEGRAILMDFGLAKMTGSTKLTRTGATVGTVAYMSPEQSQGKEVDGRTDIWALGVMLYEMVSGELPFRGEYEPALFYAIVHGDPKPLTGGKIPAGLDGIIARALAKSANERYQTVREFIGDIDALLSDRDAFPAGRAKRARGLTGAWKRWRPWERVAAVSATCVVAGALVAGVITLVQMRSARDASNLKNAVIAVIEFRSSVNPDDPTVSSGITQLVQVGLTETSPIRVISPELLYDIRRRLFGSQRRSIEPDQVLEVATTAGSTFFLTGEIMGTAAEPYVTWRLVETKSGKSLGGRRVMGRTMMELADGIIKSVLPLLPGPAEGKVPAQPSSTSEIVTSSKEAYEHYVKGDLAFDEGRVDEAVAEMQRAVEIDSTFALAYYRLAHTFFSANADDKGPTRKYAEKAWAHRDHLGFKDRMKLEALSDQLEGEIPRAIATYREIHTRWPDNLDALQFLSFYLFRYWYFEEAVTVSQQGLALYPHDPLFLGISRSAMRETGRGEEVLQAWIANARERPQQPWVWNELGECYWTMGFPDSAEACFRREKSRDGSTEFFREQQIADCFYARGDVKHAIDMREELWKELMKRPDTDTYGDEGPTTLFGGYAGGLAEYAAEIGRFSRSFELLQEYERIYSGNKTRVPGKKIELLTRMGQAAKAVDLARTTLKHITEPRDSLAINLRLIEALATADSAREARLLLTTVLKFDENVLWGSNKYDALLLRSVVALAEKDSEGALKVIRETERMAKPSTSRGKKSREILARTYWKSGRLEEAVSTYEALLRVFGGHAISHYELGQVYEEMGRKAEAKREYSKFLEMWSEADEGLPQLVDARARFAAL